MYKGQGWEKKSTQILCIKEREGGGDMKQRDG